MSTQVMVLVRDEQDQISAVGPVAPDSAAGICGRAELAGFTVAGVVPAVRPDDFAAACRRAAHGRA